jgi:3-oxoadipate enol-lactonase
MPYFETSDGCRIFYDCRPSVPSKPAVVFLNGLTQTAVNWKTISDCLGDDFGVIAYDARAQGRSDTGSLPLSLELHCSDLRELFRYLKIPRAHLVGVSHGAVVALEFASRFPDNCDRLVLCSVSASPAGRLKLFIKSWQEILQRQDLGAMARAMLPVVFGEEFLRKNEAILEKVVKAVVVRNRKDAILAQLQAGVHYPPLSRTAPHVRKPALVLSGSDDPLVTESGARELAELCNGRFRPVPGAGHSIPAETPELFLTILKEFLRY